MTANASALEPISQQKADSSRRASARYSIGHAATVFGFLLGLGACMLVAIVLPWVLLGSPDSLFRIIDGRPLSVYAKKVAGSAEDGQYRMVVKNVGASRVELFGITTNCDCVAVEFRPDSLSLGESKEFLVRRTSASGADRGTAKAWLLTDVPKQRRVEVSISD